MRLGDVKSADGGVVQRKPGGNLLRVKPVVEAHGAFRLPAEAGAVVAASWTFTGETGACVAVGTDGRAHLIRETLTTPETGPAVRAFEAVETAAEGPEAPDGLVTRSWTRTPAPRGSRTSRARCCAST